MPNFDRSLHIKNISYPDVNIQKSIQTIFHISIKQVIYVTQLYYIADHLNLILLAYFIINYNFKSYSDV